MPGWRSTFSNYLAPSSSGNLILAARIMVLIFLLVVSLELHPRHLDINDFQHRKENLNLIYKTFDRVSQAKLQTILYKIHGWISWMKMRWLRTQPRRSYQSPMTNPNQTQGDLADLILLCDTRYRRTLFLGLHLSAEQKGRDGSPPPSRRSPEIRSWPLLHIMNEREGKSS